MVESWRSILSGSFGDLVRLETELWHRVEARVQHAHGRPLAWLEIMQVVSATGDCAGRRQGVVDHRRRASKVVNNVARD